MLKRVWSKIYSIWMLLALFLSDFTRFLQFGGMTVRRSCQPAAAAWLTMYYHRIEKGLSLRETRPNFGESIVSPLTKELGVYIRKYGVDPTAAACWQALHEYHRFNRSLGTINEKLYAQFTAIQFDTEMACKADDMSAVKTVSKEAILNRATIDFESFVLSRHSIRDYSEETVSIDLIKKAAEMAQKTPSVCNRQAWRLHVYQNNEIKKRAIACQGGNKGFGEYINTVLIITAEIEHFFSPVERNQGFIDGGLYGMSLVYAFHSLGLATCCLNLSLTREQDKRLRAECEIGKNEQLIMMIAVGHYVDRFKIANSTRKPIEKVITIHE